MTKDIQPEQPIPSPCVRNCCLNEKDVCLGCFRSLAEITAWGSADSATRRDILDRARERRREAMARRGPPFP